MEQPAGSEEADPGTADPGSVGPDAVERPAAETQAPAAQAPAAQAPAAPLRDPQGSDAKPRSLYARMKLFFFRTTLGRTRRDKSDV